MSDLFDKVQIENNEFRRPLAELIRPSRLTEVVGQEKIIGSAEILEIFKVSKVGKVAGSKVIEGEITQDSNARLISSLLYTSDAADED